jgi:hypothetical protein
LGPGRRDFQIVFKRCIERKKETAISIQYIPATYLNIMYMNSIIPRNEFLRKLSGIFILIFLWGEGGAVIDTERKKKQMKISLMLGNRTRQARNPRGQNRRHLGKGTTAGHGYSH